MVQLIHTVIDSGVLLWDPPSRVCPIQPSVGAEITHSLNGLYVLLHLGLGWFSGLIPRNHTAPLWKQMMKSRSLQNKQTHVVSEGVSGFKSPSCELCLFIRQYHGCWWGSVWWRCLHHGHAHLNYLFCQQHQAELAWGGPSCPCLLPTAKPHQNTGEHQHTREPWDASVDALWLYRQSYSRQARKQELHLQAITASAQTKQRVTAAARLIPEIGSPGQRDWERRLLLQPGPLTQAGV